MKEDLIMSTTPENRFGYDNLTQSGILKFNSKDDKAISLSIGTFGGFTSFAVFVGGKPWKTNIPRISLYAMIAVLNKMMLEPHPRREAISMFEWEEENGKRRLKECGAIGYGITDNLELYIDVAANNLEGRHMFPIKQNARFGFANTCLTEKDILQANIQFLINNLQYVTETAERMTAFKRPPQSGGYNKSGGGGSWNNNKPAGAPPATGGTFGGSPSTGGDDSLHF